MQLDWEQIDGLIRRALAEDFGGAGDITTLATVKESLRTDAELIMKQDGIIAGIPVAERVFQIVYPGVNCSWFTEDGRSVKKGAVIGKVEGPVRGILSAERTALNFLQRLSGIATLTSAFVQQVKGTGVQILDTRKTTPGLRLLEKYAVRMGGGTNHRFGLFDQVLIKNNHVDSAGGIGRAVQCCLDYIKKNKLSIQLEVETRTLDEVHDALTYPVHRIMLDNMDLDTMKKAVALIAGRTEIEASGNVDLENVRSIAETGVQFISIGRLTHSAPALDISLHLSEEAGRSGGDI